jgi:hypothetical protein
MTRCVQKTPRASLMKYRSIFPQISFASCMSDDKLIQHNLLASPCLDPRLDHQVMGVKNCPSAADGLKLGLGRSEREFVVCVHQDVYLPDGWDRCLLQQLQEAERRFGPIGVAGVYGVRAVAGQQ